MRLIDADGLKQKIKKELPEMSNWGEVFVPSAIDHEPQINPETLPIVKELRAELEKAKAERDAAIRDVEWLVTGEIKACDYCKKNNPYNYTCERMEMGYCADWEWRGVKDENNS